MTGSDLQLIWRELKCEAPSTRAFRLEGALLAANVANLSTELGRLLNPKPKRLLLDVQKLARIDRAGIDTLAGMAGFFAEAEGGHIAFVAAAPLLREKLEPLAEPGSVKFFASFSQAAVRVLDHVFAKLSGQFAAAPRPPSTEIARAIWKDMRDGQQAGVQVLTRSGTFDKVSAPQFDRHWAAEFKPATRHLVLDMADVRSVVDEGIERLRRMADATRARDGTVSIVGARPKLKVMLDMLDMAQLFCFHNTVQDAQNAQGKVAP